MPRTSGIVREGLLVGALGATGVAVWFLIVDIAAGRPLFTPAALGSALFRTGAVEDGVPINLLVVAGYTIFHYLAFGVVGILAAYFTGLAERQPAVLALFLVLFVTFEMGFYGLIAVLHEIALLRELTWYLIGAGNLIATVLMGGMLLRRHPIIARNIDVALSGKPI